MRPLSLFPATIPIIGGVVDGPLVAVSNGSNARYATDAEGRRWVKKPEMGANQVRAEALGWLIGRRLGAPVLPAAFVREDGEAIWLSGYLSGVTHWSAERATYLVNHDQVAAMLVVDAVLGNVDRHDGNILIRADEGVDRPRAYAIDFGNCWAGEPTDLRDHGLDPPPIDRLVRGLPLELLEEHAFQVALTASQLDRTDVTEYVREACTIARTSREGLLLEHLIRRFEAAPDIVAEYLSSIEARK